MARSTPLNDDDKDKVKAPLTTFSCKDDLRKLATPPANGEAKQYEYWHATQTGFGVRLGRPKQKTGRSLRLYIVRYPAGSKPEKENIGPIAEWDYSAASEEVIMRRAAAREAKKEGKEAPPTLGKAFADFMKINEGTHRDATKADYAKKWKVISTYPVGPRGTPFAEMRVDKITEEMCEAFHPAIQQSNGKATAHGASRLLCAIFNRLVKVRTLPHSPADILRRVGIYKRGDPLHSAIPIDELPVVWQWMHQNLHPTTRDFMLIELFTGLRVSVVGNFRWSQMGMREKIYNVPALEPGNKKGKELKVPIPDWLFDNVLLPRWKARQARAEKNPSDWILPSPKRKGAPLRVIKHCYARMAAETGTQISDQDQKRTFSTYAASALAIAQVPPLRISRLQHHSVNAAGQMDPTSAGYITTLIEEMRYDINLVADYIVKHATAPVPLPVAHELGLSERERARENNKEKNLAKLQRRRDQNKAWRTRETEKEKAAAEVAAAVAATAAAAVPAGVP